MIIVNKEKCIGCGTCTEECHGKAVSLVDGELKWDREKCNHCGHCLAVCPRDAIIIDGDGYKSGDVEEFNAVNRATPDQIRRDIMMRRSVRDFNEEPVSEDDVLKILEAGRYAPTGKNKQGNVFLVMTDPDEREKFLDKSMDFFREYGEKMKESNPQMASFFLDKYRMYTEENEDGMFYDAPVVILIFSENDVDGGICAAHMGQMATSLNLGFTYVMLASIPFKNIEGMNEEYGIPKDKQCVIALALGNTDKEYFCSVPRKETPVIWR